MSEEENRRRRHPRIETQQHVWVEGQDVRVAAQARNMSKGGMFVVAEGEAPAIGSTLDISFDDPHEGTVALKMEVVWSDEKTLTHRLGLRAVDSIGMAAFERVVTRYETEGDRQIAGITLRPAPASTPLTPSKPPSKPDAG